MYSASFCKKVLAAQLGTRPLLLHARHRLLQQTRRRAKIKKKRKRKQRKRKRKKRQVLSNSRVRRPRVRLQHATREVCSR
jgi:hypothetical protein